MKEFNLKEAIDGGIVVNRMGAEVKYFNFLDGVGLVQPVIAIVDGTINQYSKDGNFFIDGAESHLDLFMKNIKKTGWVNIYKFQCGNEIYGTESEAVDNGKIYSNYITTIKIEWEE